MLPIVVVLIFVALTFDFINGFHDAANSIATVVSTRVLSPGKAVAWAAFFNFVAAFGFGTAVATTIGKGMIDVKVITFAVVFAGLAGAILWDLITWYFGLPTSSSHALMGGYAGAAVARAGWGVVIASGWTKTLIFIVLSPLIGMVAGLGLMTAITWIMRGATPGGVDRWFRRLQLISAGAFSLSHGTNDAQKTMGIVTGLLLAAGYITVFKVPIWVILAAHAAIALGTLAGGWRIIHTMGSKITKLQPVGGFAAETGAAARGVPQAEPGKQRRGPEDAAVPRGRARSWAREAQARQAGDHLRRRARQRARRAAWERQPSRSRAPHLHARRRVRPRLQRGREEHARLHVPERVPGRGRRDPDVLRGS